MNSSVSIVKCASYEPAQVLAAGRRAVDLLGGITRFIKPKTRVLVKPNLLLAKEPESGVTTHPELVRAVIKILKEIECQVSVGDSPNVFGNQIENVDEVYARTGIRDVCREEQVNLIKLNRRRWRGKFPLAAALDESDYLVNLPKFKTHQGTILTGAIKNLFGLVPGTYKTELHKNYFAAEDFAKILVDIYQEVKPALTIIDGIVAMEGEGPGTSGRLRNLNLLFAARDCVALDSILARAMGLEPQDILTTKEAAARGLAAGADSGPILVLGEQLEELKIKPFLLPTVPLRSKVPASIVKFAKKLVRYYPCVLEKRCIGCEACIKICPNKAISMKNNRLKFDYSRCIACFCCQEICPQAAIQIKKSLVAKIAGL